MKRPSKTRAVLMVALLLLGVATSVAFAALVGRYAYDQPGDRNFVSNTNVLERWSPTGGNNQSYKIATPRAQVKATFTTKPIVVDGVREAAWDDATPYPITNKFNAGMTADAPSATAQGTLRLLWDGPVLYIQIEVTGDTTKSDTETPIWSSSSYIPNTDGLFVSMDVFNDQWGIETDTQGVFFLSANPALTSVTSFNKLFLGVADLGLMTDDAHYVCLMPLVVDSVAHGLSVYGETLVFPSVNLVPTLQCSVQILGFNADENIPDDGLAGDNVTASLATAIETLPCLLAEAVGPI